MQIRDFSDVLDILNKTRTAYAILNQVHTNITFLFSLENDTLICREKGYKINMLLRKELRSEYIDKFTFSKKEWKSFLRETPIIDHSEEDDDFYYGYQIGGLVFRIQKTDSPFILKAWKRAISMKYEAKNANFVKACRVFG